ncbi:MAG TPA: hypothetical protein PKD90_19940, partial [Phnomibacter sp.]|nr:hypothetical protein [Phnomibacter sp.]
MAIVRPWHIRALVKLVGKTKAYQWHNQVVESSANTYWQQVFSQLQTEPPASLTEEVERQVYRQLMEKGIAFANAADFLQSDLPLLQAVEADYEAWSQSLPPITDVNNKKAYEQKRYPGRHYRQTTDPDIQLALHPRFTRLAEAYLHAPASLFYADYWHTVVSPVQQRVASQN